MLSITKITDKSWLETHELSDKLKQVDFDTIWQLHPEKYGQVRLYGKVLNTPRWQQTYGKDYVFSGMRHNALPIPDELQPYLDYVNTLGYGQYNQVLVNWYKDGTHYIGKHRDDERDIVKGRAIVSISLGATRVFRIRNHATNEILLDYPLENHNVVVMCGAFQTELTHEIVKMTGKKASDCGPRINLTFRQFINMDE